jgi:hypothetical protein
MYAVDRVKPPVPAKLHDEKDDNSIEEAKIQRAKLDERKQQSESSIK